jgi:hypothetical protein
MKEYHLSEILRISYLVYTRYNRKYDIDLNLLICRKLNNTVVYINEYNDKYSGNLYYDYYIFLLLLGNIE